MEAEPPRGFSEQPFRAACRELDEPAVGQPWQLLEESAGLRLYRLCDEQSGLYEYKIYCILDDCPPKLCVDVYMDLDYRKQWDKSVKELYEETYDGEKVIYWEVKYPYPLSNRDYVYIRECRELDVDGQKIWVVLAQSVSAPQSPEKPGVIRVKSYKVWQLEVMARPDLKFICTILIILAVRFRPGWSIGLPSGLKQKVRAFQRLNGSLVNLAENLVSYIPHTKSTEYMAFAHVPY